MRYISRAKYMEACRVLESAKATQAERIAAANVCSAYVKQEQAKTIHFQRSY